MKDTDEYNLLLNAIKYMSMTVVTIHYVQKTIRKRNNITCAKSVIFNKSQKHVDINT